MTCDTSCLVGRSERLQFIIDHNVRQQIVLFTMATVVNGISLFIASYYLAADAANNAATEMSVQVCNYDASIFSNSNCWCI